MIDYNMTADYVEDWTELDAIREFVQNAVDSDSTALYSCLEGNVLVKSRGGELKPASLALGSSTKGEGDLGKYGEGYKLAMMVLTRKELHPRIRSGWYKYSGAFILNPIMGLPTFNIIIENLDYFVEGVEFTCSLPSSSLEQLKINIPAFSDSPLSSTEFEVLEDRPGSVYVGGLFVAKDPDLTYGYNFAPGSVVLNRDRNMASGICWELARHYARSSDTEQTFNLLDRDAKDVSDLGYVPLRPEVERDLVKNFYNKYGRGAKLAKPGTSYSGQRTSVSNSMYRALSSSVESAKPSLVEGSPEHKLTEFLAKHKSKLRRSTRNDLLSLIKQSVNWKKS